MRNFFTALFAILVCLAFGSAGAAQDHSQAQRASARRELEIAVLDLRHYLQVEHPRQRRYLDGQIKIAEAEVRLWENRLREYRAFDKFSTGGPLFVTIQDARIYLLDAQLRLNDLRAERNNLIRFHSDQWRMLEIRAYEARARVAELERDDRPAAPAGAAAGG